MSASQEEPRHLLAMGDLLDEQLLSADGVKIGRVADAELAWEGDDLVVTHVVTGPQALAGRISKHLVPLARSIFRDRFERHIPVREIETSGPTTKLSRNAAEYAVGQSDRWLAKHILRFIPGSKR